MRLGLVHIDPFDGPVGIWCAEGEQLQSYYPSDYANRRARVEATLQARGDNAGTWHDWFHQLADRVPYFVDYQVIDIPDDDDLPAAYARCRGQWRPADR